MLSRREQKIIRLLKIKKHRTHEKRFLVEGTKNVLELIKSDFEIDLIIGTHLFFERHYPKNQLHRCEIVKPEKLTQISSFKTNTSVIAVVQMRSYEAVAINLEDSLFVLDGVRDPGNLGTIIRTLDWFGFDKLVCSPDSAEFYNPKVISGTMGSFTRVSVMYEDLTAFLTRFHSVPIYCADMQGEDVNTATLANPCIVVMGGESHGVSESVARLSSKSLSIPRKGGCAESLNVGVAMGIFANHLRISK